MQNVRDVFSIDIENVFFLFSPQGEKIATLEEKIEQIHKEKRNKIKNYFEQVIKKVVESKFDPLPKNMNLRNIHFRIEDTEYLYFIYIRAEHPFAIGIVIEKCQIETVQHNSGVQGTRQKSIHLKGFRMY